MTGKEKLQRALNHQEGPVPVDFGATAVTGMHVTVVGALREHYGLEQRPVKVCEPYQMLGLIEDDLRAALGIDVTGVFPPNTMFGFPLQGWKPWQAPWGQELLVPEKFNVTTQGQDITIHPQGDTSVPASGLMPESGFFFDTIVRQEPIDEATLDPADNLQEFGELSESDLRHYEEQVRLAAQTDLGLITAFPGTAFGDIALVPAPFLAHPKGIRDIAEWYMSTALRPDYIRAVFDRQLEYALSNLQRLYERIGNQITAVFLCGTDFGTQQSTFCAPATYDELWHPYYRAMNDWIHANTTWKTFKHSCGAVATFMEHFIASGFDIVNPVQCSAAGMDPMNLKRQFGDRLVFWGGGVDTQHTLPFGTPAEVRTQVLERCEIFAPGGGFVFDAIHNVQANTPVENVVAMIEAVKAFNGQRASV